MNCIKWLPVFLLLSCMALAVSARPRSATPREKVVEITFEDVRSDLSKLEDQLGEGVLSNMVATFGSKSDTGNALEFGSWEIHGALKEVGANRFFGNDLRCRFGNEPFLCKGQIVIETGPENRIFTGMLLQSDSVPIQMFIAPWAKSLARNFSSIPGGNARIGLVRSISQSSPLGDSALHRFEVLWKSQGGVMVNDTTTLIGGGLENMMRGLPFPFHKDSRRATWKVLNSKVALRYFPRFYTPEMARAKLGDDRFLQEMIVTIEITVEIPRKFLFLNSPTRYKLHINGLPLRLYEYRMREQQFHRQNNLNVHISRGYDPHVMTHTCLT